MILRSDDTDHERSTPEYASDILDNLEWLGIGWDEGIGVGGPQGSYQQSERLDRYRRVADELVAAGNAYYSFATPEQLEQFRNEARASGTAPAYDGRYEPDDAEGKRRVEEGEPATVRFRIPRPGVTEFEDVVRGTMTFDHAQVDDFVILRSDRTPTYHLASTVDDVDFDITHVIRGEDLLSSTPKHVLLTEALGAAPATYAHLSLLLGPDGKKLSKRHGDTSIAAFRSAGFLPEALVNYLALLGWSPGGDETKVTVNEMIERFSLDAVSRNPAIFDEDKLEWLNGVYIRELNPDDFAAQALPFVEEQLGRALGSDELVRYHAIAPHVQERAKRLTEVPEQVAFLFVDPVDYDQTSWDKVMHGEDAAGALEAAIESLSALDAWTTPEIEAALRAMLERLGLSARKGLQPIRVAISGSTVSPPLFESLEVLGREQSLERMSSALRLLG